MVLDRNFSLSFHPLSYPRFKMPTDDVGIFLLNRGMVTCHGSGERIYRIMLGSRNDEY